MREELLKPRGKAPLCACGCGNPVKWVKWCKRWNKYIHGHNEKGRKRSPKWKLLEVEAPLCKCGCGQRVMRSKHYPYGWNSYLNGHNPIFSMLGKHHTAETRAKMCKSIKKVVGSPESRRKRNGLNSPRWKGGVTYKDKPPELTPNLKQAIRLRDNFTCQFCGHKNNGEKRKLDTHHIDHNRKNNHPDNLITLCKSCHADTQTADDKKAWQRVYTNLIKKIKKLPLHKKAIRIYKENKQVFYRR